MLLRYIRSAGRNLGKVTDFLYRSAEPDGRLLEMIRPKTVVDLRGDLSPKEREKAMARAAKAGADWVSIPLSDKRPPEPETINRWLAMVENKSLHPILVHCKGGRHRTGGLVAAYRIRVQGWSNERAYEEAKAYGFYSAFGHGDWKKFILSFE